MGGLINAVEGAPLDLVEAGNRLRKIEQEIARLKVKKSTSPSDKSGEIRRNGQHRKRTLSKATPSKTSPALRQSPRTPGQISATPTNLFNQEAKNIPLFTPEISPRKEGNMVRPPARGQRISTTLRLFNREARSITLVPSSRTPQVHEGSTSGKSDSLFRQEAVEIPVKNTGRIRRQARSGPKDTERLHSEFFNREALDISATASKAIKISSRGASSGGVTSSGKATGNMTDSKAFTLPTAKQSETTAKPAQVNKPAQTSKKSSTHPQGALAQFLKQKADPSAVAISNPVVVPQGSPLLALANMRPPKKAEQKDQKVSPETKSAGEAKKTMPHSPTSGSMLSPGIVASSKTLLIANKGTGPRVSSTTTSESSTSKATAAENPQLNDGSTPEHKTSPIPATSNAKTLEFKPQEATEITTLTTEKKENNGTENSVSTALLAEKSNPVNEVNSAPSQTKKLDDACPSPESKKVTVARIPYSPLALLETNVLPVKADKKSLTDTVAQKASEVKSDKNEESEADKAIYKTTAYASLPATVIATEESPKLSFSGDFCSYFGSVNQEDARDNADGSPHLAIGWADLAMEISGATNDDFQYKYSANIQVIPDDFCMTENYVEFASHFGTMQFGNVSGVESAFIEDATSLIGGTGGVNGSVWDLFNRAAGMPNMVHLAGFTKKSTKFVLYSPRFYGFKVGLSYSPNPNHMGWNSQGSTAYANINSNDDNVFHNEDMHKTNNVAVGLNFEHNLNDLTVSAALVALTENTTMDIDVQQTASAEDISNAAKTVYSVKREIALKKDWAYQASASIKYKNFQIAGGFIENNELNLPKTKYDADRLAKYGFHLGDAGKGWNLGGKYTFGCLDFSLAHHTMRRRVTNYSDTIGKVNTLAVDCQIVSGVTVFTEINRIETSTDKSVSALYGNNNPVSNKGTTVFVGSKISF